MDCCPRNLVLTTFTKGCLLPLFPRRVPAAWILAAGRADFREEARVREAVSEVRVLTLTVLGLVLAAAGALHSRAAVANKTVVLILIRDHIKDTSRR